MEGTRGKKKKSKPKKTITKKHVSIINNPTQ